MLDPNSNQTTFTYSDPLGRVTLANYPNTGSISVLYSDVGAPDTYPITMQVTTPTGETSGSKVATTTYDGLARPIETDTLTASAGPTIVVKTNYDNMGRTYQMSNPYYSTGSPDWTTTTFDSLGRAASTQNPDGTSKIVLRYNGVATSGQGNCNSRLGNGFVGSWTDASDRERQRLAACDGWSRTPAPCHGA